MAASKVRGRTPARWCTPHNHKPVLAWESTVRGTAKDGTPIRNLVYTDARTGKQLAVHPQIVTDTGTGKLALQRDASA